MRILRCLVWWGLILGLIGCQGRYTLPLKQAEIWIGNAPDSALVILDSIRIDDIRNPTQQAKYALLYSQALDKNYIDTTNDSLIRIAVNYYREHGQLKDRMKAYYYLGRIQFNSNNYPQAIISFLNAEKCAANLNDYNFLGLIYRGITDIYNATYNPEELKYAQKSYDSFKKAGAEQHANYALLNIGIAYNNQRQYKKSAETYEQVIELARNASDTTLWASCLTSYVHLCMLTDRPLKARQMLISVRDELKVTLSAEDLGCMAYAYAMDGKTDSAAYLLGKANAIAVDEASRGSLAATKCQIYKLDHKYQNALSCYEQAVNAQDSIVRTVLDQSVISAQRDFFQKQLDAEFYKIKTQRYLIIMTVVIALLIVACCVLYFRRRMQIKNLEIDEYMSIAHEVRTMLQDRNVKIFGMSQLIEQLFKERFAFIDRLGNTYYERQHTPTRQEAIYRDVKKAIDSLGTDKCTIDELEKIVNAWRKDIMRKVRAQIPELKKSDYQLLCYLYAGFSYRTISIFTQDKIENIYNRKSRLRTRIADSDAADKKLFLDDMT